MTVRQEIFIPPEGSLLFDRAQAFSPTAASFCNLFNPDPESFGPSSPLSVAFGMLLVLSSLFPIVMIYIAFDNRGRYRSDMGCKTRISLKTSRASKRLNIHDPRGFLIQFILPGLAV